MVRTKPNLGQPWSTGSQCSTPSACLPQLTAGQNAQWKASTMPFPRVMVSGLNCIAAVHRAVGGRYPSLLAAFCSAAPYTDCEPSRPTAPPGLLQGDAVLLCDGTVGGCMQARAMCIQCTWLWAAGKDVDLDPVPCPSAVLALQQQCGIGRALPSTHS